MDSGPTQNRTSTKRVPICFYFTVIGMFFGLIVFVVLFAFSRGPQKLALLEDILVFSPSSCTHAWLGQSPTFIWPGSKQVRCANPVTHFPESSHLALGLNEPFLHKSSDCRRTFPTQQKHRQTAAGLGMEIIIIIIKKRHTKTARRPPVDVWESKANRSARFSLRPALLFLPTFAHCCLMSSRVEMQPMASLSSSGSVSWFEFGVPKSPIVFETHNTTQHDTTRHDTTQQHNTTQHNTAPHGTAQHSTAQHSTAQHNTTQHNTTQHNTHTHTHGDKYVSVFSPGQKLKVKPKGEKGVMGWFGFLGWVGLGLVCANGDPSLGGFLVGSGHPLAF